MQIVLSIFVDELSMNWIVVVNKILIGPMPLFKPGGGDGVLSLFYWITTTAKVIKWCLRNGFVLL